MPNIPSRAMVATGAIAIAAAATLRFAVVPSQAQLPADTDSARQYAGTVNVILDAQALAAGDIANAIIRDIPVTLNRTSKVTGVADGNATVFETGNVVAPDGTTLAGYETTFEVDRKTMEGVGDRSGLVMGWPIGTEARDYVGWSGDLQANVNLTYERTEDFAGIDAYVFTSDVQGQIVDQATLAQFPSTLPKFALPLVAGALDVPEAIAAQLPTFLEVLPDEVPLAYLLNSQTTYWVDPATGMVLDLDRTEARQVAFDVPGVPMVGLADVYSISYQGTEASVADTVSESNANASMLRNFGTTLPIALVLIGLALLGWAFARRRQVDVVVLDDARPGTAQSASSDRELADV